MLYVGQRVVCVDDRRGALDVYVYPHERLPKRGIVYTIREIIPCRELYGYDDDALYLAEIVLFLRVHALR